MIGARAVAGAIENARTAMAADIVKRPDRPVAIAQNDDAFGAKIEGQVVACGRDRVDVADDLPARQQHALQLQALQGGVAVHPGGHGPRQVRRSGIVGEGSGAAFAMGLLQGCYMIV